MRCRFFSTMWAFAILMGLFITSVQAEESTKSGKAPELFVEVKLSDDSVMKLQLADEKLEFQTKYGKLNVPMADIRRIELGHRVPDEIAKQIERAIKDLGSAQFRQREEASVLLTGLKEKAFPALLKASQSGDPEVAKRVEEIIEKIRSEVPETKLNVPEFDTIHTSDSKFVGRISVQQLKVKSTTLGELTLKLSDIVSIGSGGLDNERDIAQAQPDPGSLTGFQREIGKTFVFKVTGVVVGNVWGTEMYTLDSTLAAAAVHMGIVKPGQTGYVKVTILGPANNFVGSTRNGVTSAPYQNYPGAFKIIMK